MKQVEETYISLLTELQVQANIWNGNEQEFTDLLPRQLLMADRL